MVHLQLIKQKNNIRMYLIYTLCLSFLCGCSSKVNYEQCETMKKSLAASDASSCYIFQLGSYKNLNYKKVDVIPVEEIDIDNYINKISPVYKLFKRLCIPYWNYIAFSLLPPFLLIFSYIIIIHKLSYSWSCYV